VNTNCLSNPVRFINQIARAANATGEISEELQGSLAYARGVLKRMDVVLESLSLDGGQS
jgi:hypothetical protein